MSDDQTFGKRSVWVILLLSIITCGLYFPFWFVLRANDLDKLQTTAKITLGPVVLLFCSLIATYAASIAGIWWTSEAGATTLKIVGPVLNLCYCIMIWVLSFRVRRILDEYFNQRLNLGSPISAVATFFLTIYYLQYKMNRFPAVARVEPMSESGVPPTTPR